MPDDLPPYPMSARVKALRRSGVLDLPGDTQFAHLTELVRMMLGVPVAIVSIVDEHRQVFAGHSGLPEPWASLGQTPITHSFCQHVVERGTVLSVSDARAEPLVRDNLAISELGVAAYLGVPIHLPGGELIGALAAIDTVPRTWSEHDLRLLESVAVVVDKEIRVGSSERKFRTLFEEMREGFYVGEVIRDDGGQHVVDFRFDEVNPAFGHLTGMPVERATGALMGDVAPAAMPLLLPVYERLLLERTSIVHVHRSAFLDGHWFETRMTPLDGDRLVGFFTDVTDRRNSEALQDVLNQEMSHRLKNTLMMVQALAMQTLRGVSERAPVEALEKRIYALSSAHDILFERNWESASVDGIARAALGRLCMEGRVDLAGPGVEMGAKATLSLSLLLHELATNAIKYGALSNADGRVALDWSMDGTDFHLRWRETGGPVVSEPSQRGFGSKLIRMGLGAGDVVTRYEPLGFFLELTTPLSHMKQA